MRTTGTLLLALGLGALSCGGDPPKVQAPPPRPSAVPSAIGSAAPRPEPPPDAEPTARTEEQKRRDEGAAKKAAAIVDSFLDVDAHVLADGKRFVFRSNRDGVWQAYLGDVRDPKATLVKLTSGRERVTGARPTVDDRYVLFTSDVGGDENYRIFRVPVGKGDAPAAEPVSLTPGEKVHRDAPVLARKRPDRMAYSARDNREPKTTVYVQSIESPGDPKQVYVDPQLAVLVDMSPDGKRGLILRINAYSDNVLLEIDLEKETKTPVRLYPPDGKKAHLGAARYDATGGRVYVATDDGGETHHLVSLDRASKRVVSRWEMDAPKTAAIDDVDVSPDGKRLALAVDAGNRREIRILSADLKPDRSVSLPLGVATPTAFTPDGKGLTIVQSTAEKPQDVLLLDVSSGAARPLRDDPRPGLAALPPIDVTIESVRAHDGLSIPVNLYLPRIENRRRLPTIVSVHGGPASASRVGWNPTTRFFVSEGYAVVEPNVRGSSGFGRAYVTADDREKRDDAVKDLETVNRWARGQLWCQYDRMTVMGASYGGYMTLMALTRQPTLWRAGVDLFGPSDLKVLMRSTAATIRVLLTEEFGDLDKDAPLLGRLSPIRDIANISGALFVYQGQNDPRVPRAESDAIVLALRKRHLPVEYMLAADEGHSLDRKENRVEFMARVLRFLDDNVKNAK